MDIGLYGPYMIYMRDLENIKGSRVYGRRLAAALSPARQARLDKWLPKIEIILPDQKPDDEPGDPIAPEEYFKRPPQDYWLEIGFGKGEHLATQAENNPSVGLIGCEPFINGVSSLVDQLEARGLENIRIFKDDARLMMDSLPDKSIGRAFILFPDPWPKARHHKRRIVSAGNIAALARILKDGAELRIGTDHMEYCRWIVAHMLSSQDFDWVCDKPENWRARSKDWPPSRYEGKSLEQGRKSSYLRFIRRPRTA
ncbi:tRNA (guanine(46)-N(7))-methyltransferase [hydrothermal vent metagenome]|uniref:tRNA (guanine(46)-N(7))-methyltransferase n=1 Tax=hydrothermal vent metagenome TaxID=652676 RepID=A0A3B1BDY2_9ZZZZ